MITRLCHLGLYRHISTCTSFLTNLFDWRPRPKNGRTANLFVNRTALCERGFIVPTNCRLCNLGLSQSLCFTAKVTQKTRNCSSINATKARFAYLKPQNLSGYGSGRFAESRAKSVQKLLRLRITGPSVSRDSPAIADHHLKSPDFKWLVR